MSIEVISNTNLQSVCCYEHLSALRLAILVVQFALWEGLTLVFMDRVKDSVSFRVTVMVTVGVITISNSTSQPVSRSKHNIENEDLPKYNACSLFITALLMLPSTPDSYTRTCAAPTRKCALPSSNDVTSCLTNSDLPSTMRSTRS